MEITVDLETTAIDANAGVMQIAAVAWERYGDKFEVVEEFNQGIDLRDLFSRKEEFTFDNGTAEWWGKQSDEAHRAMLSTQADLLVDAVNNFSSWIVDIYNEHPDNGIHIWAQGAAFDMPKLQHLFAVVFKKTPWPYNAVRCARTYALEAADLLGLPEAKDIYKRYQELSAEGAPHDALFDAKRTAYTTWNVMRELREKVRG